MYPHERSLVKRLANKPFALIGVNSDKDKKKLKVRMKEENITWRSFWNGPQGTGGPISKAWGVRGWPTIYVIDAEGIIRYKNARGPAMDKAVNTLLREMGEEVADTGGGGDESGDGGSGGGRGGRGGGRGAGAPQTVDAKETVERDGRRYELDGKTLFTGTVLTHHSNGKKNQELNYKNGKPEGLQRSWDNSGRKRFETTYQNGQLNGKYTWWHQNGEKSNEMNFKNGKAVGVSTRWYQSGQKSHQTTFGVVGPASYSEWHENGQRSKYGTYKGFNRDGKETTWYDNGQKKWEVIYVNDKLEGLATRWHENGQKAGEAIFKDGEKISETDWDEDGNEIKGVAGLRNFGAEITRNEQDEVVEVNLDNTQITDVGLVHLKDLANLQKLNLNRTEITDAGLSHLKKLTNLQTLFLKDTKVTDAGIPELQEALPNCETTK